MPQYRHSGRAQRSAGCKAAIAARGDAHRTFSQLLCGAKNAGNHPSKACVFSLSRRFECDGLNAAFDTL